MNVLTVLVTLGLVVAIGTSDAGAADRTARLTDPATTGPGHSERVIPREGRGDNAALPLPARPLGLSEIEQLGIRDAIRGQIKALAARDAKRAFSYLAPTTQDYFADAGAFLGTLIAQIKPLTDVSDFSFSEIEREATDAIQNVVMADPQGREWLARFTLERLPSGQWGIKACNVEPLTGNPI